MSGYDGPPVEYASKRDLWLEVVIWLASLAVFAAAAVALAEPGRSPWPRLLSAVLLGGVAGFGPWLFYTTRYRLTAQELVACAGPVRWRVPLSAIEEVVPTRIPLAGPACSLDRLLVRHPGRRLGLLISPAERDDFLRELRLRCPHLVQTGDRLVRQAPRPAE